MKKGSADSVCSVITVGTYIVAIFYRAACKFSESK